MAQQGFGAVRKPLVGLSVPMMGRVCQRASDRGPTGSMVCRRLVTSALNRPSIAPHRRKGQRWPNRHFSPLGATFPSLRRSRGNTNRSGRPRSPSLRPDGAWTVPTSARTVSRGWEGVKVAGRQDGRGEAALHSSHVNTSKRCPRAHASRRPRMPPAI